MTKAKPVQPVKKHLPRRTCIACRKEALKREFVRLVYIEGAGVEIDLTGKKTGRGAYLCPEEACWEKAIISGKLEFALRTTLKTENKEKLVNYAKGLNNTDSGVKRS
jgi:uncharacterized protein